MINVKPELRIDGQVVATGEITGLGDTNIFNMTFSSPSHGSDQITNLIDAGVYQAIGLNLGQISGDQLSSLKAELEETKAKLEARIVGGLTKDDLVGDFLNTIALTYHAEFNTKNFITSRSIGVNIATLPSETVFSTNLKVLTLFGIPRYASSSGYAMDADRLVNVVIAKDGKDEKETAFMLRSGTTSSALEHQVPEQFFSTTDSPVEGISAVKALQLANEFKIPIYKITHQNFTSVMPQLQLDKQVKDDIQNAVNSGKEVTVSKTNINFNGWNGCGYIILNPETGAAGYLLSGGINGGLEEDPNASRKDAIFFVSIMASVVSILVFGPLLGLFVTLLIAAAVTAAVKYLDGDLSSITPKDVLKYVADVVVWTAIGAGIAALAISGAPFLLVLLTILLLLFPVAILDYIFINTFLIYKRYLEYV
ncbi:MAG: hypothetical protein DRQ58_09500 [Gammaproteobacteria bacterium]|nr:MAG: hypothetical protein DRQ58_09500 [Gammaproteobacteria bacterium]